MNKQLEMTINDNTIRDGDFIAHHHFYEDMGIYHHIAGKGKGELTLEDGSTKTLCSLFGFTKITRPFHLLGQISNMDAYDITQEVVDAILASNKILHELLLTADKNAGIRAFKAAVTGLGMFGDGVLVQGYYIPGPDERTILSIRSAVTKLPITITNFRDMIERHVHKTLQRPIKATSENTIKNGDRIKIRNPDTQEEAEYIFVAHPPGTTRVFVKDELGNGGTVNPSWIVARRDGNPQSDQPDTNDINLLPAIQSPTNEEKINRLESRLARHMEHRKAASISGSDTRAIDDIITIEQQTLNQLLKNVEGGGCSSPQVSSSGTNDSGFWAMYELEYGGLKKVWFIDDDSFEEFLSGRNVRWARKE